MIATKQETLEQKVLNGSEPHWKSYQEYTEALTISGRKLAFGAAAICWTFKDKTFPPFVLTSLLFVSIFFFFDILQYFVAATTLRIWLRFMEKKYQREHNSLKGNYSKPATLDVAPYTLWILKIVFLSLSYVFIGIHIFFFSGLLSNP